MGTRRSKIRVATDSIKLTFKVKIYIGSYNVSVDGGKLAYF